MDDVLQAENLPGATTYRFKLTEPISGFVEVLNRPGKKVKLSDFAGPLRYGTTYEMQVSTELMNTGVFTPYGPACGVTTEEKSKPQLASAYCSAVNVSRSQWIYADAVDGASGYCFKVEHPLLAQVEVYGPTSRPRFKLKHLAKPTHPGATYKVSVNAYANKAFTGYGNYCALSTKAATTPPTLIAHFPFDQCAGTNAWDLTNTYSLAVLQAVWDRGYLEQSLWYDGVNDRASMPYDPAFDVSNSVSVAAWVKGDAQGSAAVIGRNTTVLKTWLMVAEGNKLQVWLSSNGNTTAKNYETSVPVFDGQWHHVAFLFEANQLKIFVDGVEDLSVNKLQDATVNSMNVGVLPFDVGYTGAVGSTLPGHYKGNVDEIYYYSGVLSPLDILTLAQQTPNPQPCAPPETTYAVLSRKLDGGFYLTRDNHLYFSYDEDYIKHNLEFRIFDYSQSVVAAFDEQDYPDLITNHGNNRYGIQFSTAIGGQGIPLPDGTYTFEVTNQKKERFLLRFKHEYTP